MAALAAPAQVRRQMFGDYADDGLPRWSNASAGLDTATQALLTRAVNARLAAQEHEISRAFSIFSSTHYFKPPAPKRTWVEVGYFNGELPWASTAITISAPSVQYFRWKTEEPAAERGVWELLRAGAKPGQETLLQSGVAGKAPTNVFAIDLSKYLPAQPPAVPAVYYVRVTPGTNPSTGLSPNQGAPGPKIAGEPVGPTSDPVTITYTSVSSPPIELHSYYFYTEAEFSPDSIYMVQDQEGPGAEEFHVAGFVQETLPALSGVLGKQGRFGVYAQLDPEGPREQAFLYQPTTFQFSNPDSTGWPRVYSVVVSVLEEDDGGSLNQWQAAIWQVADDMLGGELAAAVQKYIEGYIKDHLGQTLDDILKAGEVAGDIVQVVAGVLEATVGAILGWLVIVIAFVASDIISGMQDDYYGTEVTVFMLPSNITDVVESLLPGQETPNGQAYLVTQSVNLRGASSWPSAALYDGMVQISWDWEFRKKVLFL